jgi:hypothetical protein
LEHFPDDAPPLVAAPRHLRRRPYHAEIPDELLVPGVVPSTFVTPRPASAKRAADADLDPREAAYRRKRRVALISAVFVAISVPTLVIALLLAG